MLCEHNWVLYYYYSSIQEILDAPTKFGNQPGYSPEPDFSVCEEVD